MYLSNSIHSSRQIFTFTFRSGRHGRYKGMNFDCFNICRLVSSAEVNQDLDVISWKWKYVSDFFHILIANGNELSANVSCFIFIVSLKFTVLRKHWSYYHFPHVLNFKDFLFAYNISICVGGRTTHSKYLRGCMQNLNPSSCFTRVLPTIFGCVCLFAAILGKIKACTCRSRW